MRASLSGSVPIEVLKVIPVSIAHSVDSDGDLQSDNRRPSPMAFTAPLSWRTLAGLAQRLREHGVQIAITVCVFIIFMAVGSGNLEIFVSVEHGSSTLPMLVATPQFVMLVAIGCLMATLLPVLKPIAGSVLTFACMTPVYWMGFTTTVRPLLPMEFSLLTILLMYIVHVLVSYFKETYQKQKVIDIFSQYVPPSLAQALSRNPGAVELGGEARELTIMFCDVHDFTQTAEDMDPKELSALLNAMFTPLTEVVHRHGGTIDKFIGDALMAFWGAPLHDPMHAGNAISAAFEMQQAMTTLNLEFAARGWPQLSVGIGVNSGVVHVGNMGSRYRMAYTVIGDAVNLASRLESLTRVFNVPIVVGESTRKLFPAAGYRELGLVKIKGKQNLARVFEPSQAGMDPDSTVLAKTQRHNTALAHYYQRQWLDAQKLFRRLADADPYDPLYNYYLERIDTFMRAPPPDDWRGELRFTVS
ncbi:MAG: adenylate cyclase [Gammaproteobacteria bacterium]